MSLSLKDEVLLLVVAAVGAALGSWLLRPYEEAKRLSLTKAQEVVDDHLKSSYAYTQAASDWCKHGDPGELLVFQTASGAYRTNLNRLDVYFSGGTDVKPLVERSDQLYECMGNICGRSAPARDAVDRSPDAEKYKEARGPVRQMLKRANKCVASAALKSRDLGDVGSDCLQIEVPAICASPLTCGAAGTGGT